MLRVLASDLDPETIRPKRAYRRNRYFARDELSRLCLGVLRTSGGEPLSTDDITGRVIAAKLALVFCSRPRRVPLLRISVKRARRLLLNRGVHYSLNCAERQRTAAGTPSVVAIWRKRAPCSVVVA